MESHYEPASQEQVFRPLSILGKVLQQIWVGRILDRRTEVFVSLRQISQIWESRGGIVQMHNLLNNRRVVPTALGRVPIVPGQDAGRWSGKRRDGGDGRGDNQQSGDEEFREHNDKQAS